jgi:D-3-phosphoglycerate dehydrogenase
MAQTGLSYPKSKIKVVLLEGIHESAAETLKANGYTNIEQRVGALSEAELLELVPKTHILGIRSRTQLTKPVLEAADRLLTIGCFCIGTDQVDLKTANLAGVPVFNAPFSNTRSVAELVIGHIIYLMRGVGEKNLLAHRGEWQKSAAGAHEVRGKTLGIIGYGRIGTQVSVLAEALGMKIIYYDPIKQLALGNARPARSLSDLLGEADVVTLHVPNTADTRQMIGAQEITLMKPGAKLINTSRGKVVDIDAAAKALKEGHLSGGAFDVFPREPASKSEKFESPLQQFDNVILTPHIGGSTVEAQENIGFEVAQKLITYVDNGSTHMAVNFPEVDLPPQKDRNRLLHVHRNQPGVLSAINDILRQQGINIAAQYLQTDSTTGYVVIDTDRSTKLSITELKAIPGTIKARVLY